MDWIFEVGDKLRQSNLTIHTAACYLDLLLHEYESEMTPDKLHIVAITSLLLACKPISLSSIAKYDELDDNIPLIRDF